MTANDQIQGLSEVLQEMRDKVDLVTLAIQDMEEAKAVRSLFIQRLNSYLLAVGSVMLIMKTQGEGYASQVKKGKQFSDWYNQKENLFRKPGKGKRGTNPTWVYLEAARDVTTHQQHVKPQDAYRGTRDIHTLFKLRDEAEPAEQQPEQILSTGSNLVEEVVRNDEKIYLFKPLQIIERGKLIATLQPPNDDVITVCNNHILTLEILIDECKTSLE
jgi:hypothetical protein